MRRCDICFTPIPAGQDTCPNCGYKLKPEKHATPEERQEKKRRYMAQFTPHPFDNSSTEKKKQKTNSKVKLVLISLVILIIVIAVVLVAGFIIDVANTSSDVASTPSYVTEEYGSLSALRDDYPDIAIHVDEVSQDLEECFSRVTAEDDPYTYQSFTVLDGAFASGYMTMSSFEDEDCQLDITFSNYYDDETVPWNESYEVVLDDGNGLDQHAFTILAGVTGLNEMTLVEHGFMQYQHCRENMTDEGCQVIDSDISGGDLVFNAFPQETGIYVTMSWEVQGG